MNELRLKWAFSFLPLFWYFTSFFNFMPFIFQPLVVSIHKLKRSFVLLCYWTYFSIQVSSVAFLLQHLVQIPDHVVIRCSRGVGDELSFKHLALLILVPGSVFIRVELRFRIKLEFVVRETVIIVWRQCHFVWVFFAWTKAGVCGPKGTSSSRWLFFKGFAWNSPRLINVSRRDKWIFQNLMNNLILTGQISHE